MSQSRAILAALKKELRVLAAPWLAVVAAVALASLIPDALLTPVAAVGAIGLGAWSVGHEYSCRTLPLLLAQPCERRTLWLAKQGVLLSGLVGLAAATLGALSMAESAVVIDVVFPTGLGAGLTIAPWLSMAARSARGGIIFTLATLLFWFVAGTWTGETIANRFPETFTDPGAFASTLVQSGFVAMFALAAWLGWRTFGRLGAFDERTEHVTLPVFRRTAATAASPGRRRPLTALVQKELALQVPVFIVSAAYVLAWLAGWLLSSGAREALVIAATFVHGGIIPVMAGAMASAEERRMGTLAPQLLQPVAARVQWLVKVGVVIGLVLLLVLGLPVLLQAMDTSMLADGGLRPILLGAGFYRPRDLSVLIPLVTLGTTLSLYCSSLASNSLHALLTSISSGALFAIGANEAAWVLDRVQRQIVSELQRALSARYDLTTPREVLRAWGRHFDEQRETLETILIGLVVALMAGLFVLMLRSAAENHRFMDHRRGRVVSQVLGMLAVPVAALVVLLALPFVFLFLRP